MLAHRFDQDPPFMDVQRQGLLRVDVFSGLAGLDAGQHPLEFGGGDDHRLDVSAIQHFPVVLVDRPVGFLVGLEGFGPGQIAVAQGDDLSVVGQLIEQQPCPVADADGADGDPPAGTRAAVQAQGRRVTR